MAIIDVHWPNRNHTGLFKITLIRSKSHRFLFKITPTLTKYVYFEQNHIDQFKTTLLP